MKQIKFALLMIGLFLVLGVGTAAAVCSNNAPANGDTVICDTTAPNPDPGGVINAAADNVTVIVLPGAATQGIDLNDNANISNSGTIENPADHGINLNNNGTVINTGSIQNNGDDGVNAENNVTVSNNGSITGNTEDGIDADDGIIVNAGQINGNGSDGIEVDGGTVMLIINTGQIVGNAGQGIDAFGSTIVINGGLIANNGAEEVSLSDDPDLFENLPGGQVINTPGSAAIAFFDGNDTMIIHVGSSVEGYIHGGSGFDTFILTGETSDEELWAFLAENSKCTFVSCFWVFNLDGAFYDLRAFENFTSLLTFRALPGEFVPNTQTLCEDGNIKVFRLPNGDILVYSGFALRAPNGFLVAKITPADLVARGVRFQDRGVENPGWYAEVNYSTPRSLQVFNAAGQAVGSKCGF